MLHIIKAGLGKKEAGLCTIYIQIKSKIKQPLATYMLYRGVLLAEEQVFLTNFSHCLFSRYIFAYTFSIIVGTRNVS